MKPSITVSPPPADTDHVLDSKITATLLISIDFAVILIISSHGGITEMPLWTACIVVWCVSLVLMSAGIWMNRTMLFVPAYIVWTITFILSILFIAIDAYASFFCGKTSGNKTGQWSSPCDTLIRRKGSLSCYFLLILLKHVQVFHARTLSQQIEARYGTKTNMPKSRKDPESDDDDMVVFEKIAGAFKGDRPKISDMGRSSIA